MYLLLAISIVVGTAIWVFLDAKAIGVRKGQIKGLGDLSPTGWLIACLGIWIVSFPLYLFNRGKLKIANGKPSGSLAATLSGVCALGAVVVCVVLAGVEGKRYLLEEGARPVVSRIIAEQLGGSASCVRVRITDKITGNLYKATATLDTGIDVPITIEDRGEQILVRVAR